MLVACPPIWEAGFPHFVIRKQRIGDIGSFARMDTGRGRAEAEFPAVWSWFICPMAI
jgi:hypothetical protein